MATYTLISSVTVGSGGAASIAFTSIPSIYTDLVLKTSLRTDRAFQVDGLNVAFNGSTSNFTLRRIYGNGSTATSDTGTVQIGIINGNTSAANTFGNTESYIPNYAGSNNKSYSSDSVVEDNATFARNDLYAGLWSDTSVINSITLTPLIGPNFVQYSTAYLYGISNA